MKKTGLKREGSDKFYTIPEIVELCLKEISNNINILKSHLIIEPSAGDGAFIPGIKKITDNYEFYDIEPEHEEIKQLDYLDYIPTPGKFDKIHVIGNPPYGRQSSLAVKFIKKSLGFCDTLSFILPRSFKKDTMKKHFDVSFHLIKEMEIPEYAFTIDNEKYNVPCVLQIWIKRDTPRDVQEKIEPRGFEFVKHPEDADIYFRRVGVNAGKMGMLPCDVSKQSHYFIKFNNNKSPGEILDVLKNIEFECNNTVGPKSINKQEIIKEFNKFLE